MVGAYYGRTIITLGVTKGERLLLLTLPTKSVKVPRSVRGKCSFMERGYCLKSLKTFVYSYFLYDNANNLSYTVAITGLYFVCALNIRLCHSAML